jgi:hypothetical protein
MYEELEKHQKCVYMTTYKSILCALETTEYVKNMVTVSWAAEKKY